MSDPNENIAPGFPDPRAGHASAHPPAAGDDHGHAAPSFGAYMGVFIALCVCTALSFAVNLLLGQNHTSAGIILAVAVVKAALVAGIFMHLKFDWGKLYCIILPVCVVTVMMVIILSIDSVLAWHAYPESSFPSIK
jgi:caa(3)-type oxidase subunit IV